MTRGTVCVILNGKKSGLPEIRPTINTLRKKGWGIEVRVTWEYGDIKRFIKEVVDNSIPRIVAGGGDGTLNEIANAIVEFMPADRPEMAVLPLGTANDFASACKIPTTIQEALELAVTGKPQTVDLGKANDRHFINVATGGFGAQVTVETPTQLKNFLGGGAYTLTGLAKALRFAPVSGLMRTAESEETLDLIIGAICNGRQAGGGQQLAPSAFINDGVLDVTIVTTFPMSDLDIVISELLNPEQSGKYVKRFQTRWLDVSSMGNVEQVNLDGEPYSSNQVRFEVVPGAVKLVLPSNCPCIRNLDKPI